MKLYKVTGENGITFHGGVGYWPLPNGSPGAWMEVSGPLVPCENGLHLCRASDLLDWLGPVIWEAEHEGEALIQDDKIVARKARLARRCEGWTEQTVRLFAADCAERVLQIANDPRCDAAVIAVRRHAFGLIDSVAWATTCTAASEAYSAAVWDANSGAAREATSAARYAARAAFFSPFWEAARYAADTSFWAAAGAVAFSGARAAGSDAARDAEKAWQTGRLMEYIHGRVDLDEVRARLELGK